MAKSYITLDTRIDSFKDEFNNLVNKVGDLNTLTTVSSDSDLVQSINILDAELGTITAGAMGTTASTVSTAIAELDAEADSDRTNFGANVKNLMLMDGTSKHVTVTANNSTNETTFITFVDGSADSQGIETDTGLTYNPSSGLITAVSLAAATLDISGNVDIDGTLEVGAISGTSADFDAGVTIDNLTIDGTSVASSSTLSLDAAGDITIDAGGAEINLKDDGTTVGHISMASSNLEIKSSVSDKDMIFKGNDGGSEITALTFDMSNAGKATFNNAVTTGAVITSGAGLVIADDGTIGPASDADAIQLNADGTMTMSGGDLKLKHDGSILMFGANDDVTLTHVHDTGLLLNGTMALQFNDASQNINAPSNTVLDINATDEIELTATLIDVVGNLAGSGTGTFAGILKTDDTTEATSTTDGSLQTDGGLSVAKDIVAGDDIKLLSDSAVIHFGADSDITLTHAADTSLTTNGVMIATTFEPSADTAAGDNAAIGYTSAEGLILTGQGSTNDVTIKNDADADVIEIPTGTTNVTVAGTLGTGGAITSGAGLVIANAGTIGSASVTDAIIIDSAGRIQVNGTAVVDVGRISVSFNSADSTGVSVKCLNANGGTIMRYHNSSNASIGGITSDGSTTAFATSSDYRLKENVDYTWDATTRLKQLKPARFNFIADESNTLVDGFIAHEVSSIVPEAIIGEKDATEMQGIDQSKLVPLLVKTIQELEARIKTLEDA